MFNSIKHTQLWISMLLLLGGAFWIFSHFPHDSFWYDEAVNAYLATSSWSTQWEWSTEIDNQLPLHFALLKVWGYGVGSSEFSMRMLSASCGLLSLAGLMRLGQQFNQKQLSGWLAALFFALSGSFLYMASEVRTYGLAVALLIWSCVFLLRIWPLWPTRSLAVSRNRDTAIYLVLTILLLYTHYTAFIAVGVQGLYVLASLLRTKQGWPRAITIAIILLLGVAPWLAILTGRDVNEGILYEADFTIPEALNTYWQFYTYGQRLTTSTHDLPAYGLLGLVFVGLLIFILRKRSLDSGILFSLGMAVLPAAGMALAVTQIQPHLAGRHTWAMWVGVALLFGLSWEQILNVFAPNWQKVSAVILLAILPFYVATQSTQLPEAGQGDLRGAFNILETHAQPTDLLVLRDGTLFVAAEYYDTSLPYIGLPDTKLTDVNHRLQIIEGESLLNLALTDETTAIWVLSWQGENEDPLMMGWAYGEYFSQGQREVWLKDAPLDEPRQVSLIRYPITQPRPQPLLQHIRELPDVLKIGADGPGMVGYEVYPLFSTVPEPACAVVAHVWWWRGEVDYPDAQISLRVYDPHNEIIAISDQKLTGFSFEQTDWLAGAPVLGRVSVEPDCAEFETGQQYEVEFYIYSVEDKFAAQTVDAALFTAP